MVRLLLADLRDTQPGGALRRPARRRSRVHSRRSHRPALRSAVRPGRDGPGTARRRWPACCRWPGTGRASRSRWPRSSLPYLLVVSTYPMWWGGYSAPGRFAVVVLLPAALPLAALWAAGRFGRGVIVALTVVSAAITAALVAHDRGAFIYNGRDGHALLLDWLSPTVDLTLGTPSVHRDGALAAAGDAAIWLAAGGRRRGPLGAAGPAPAPRGGDRGGRRAGGARGGHDGAARGVGGARSAGDHPAHLADGVHRPLASGGASTGRGADADAVARRFRRCSAGSASTPASAATGHPARRRCCRFHWCRPATTTSSPTAAPASRAPRRCGWAATTCRWRCGRSRGDRPASLAWC